MARIAGKKKPPLLPVKSRSGRKHAGECRRKFYGDREGAGAGVERVLEGPGIEGFAIADRAERPDVVDGGRLLRVKRGEGREAETPGQTKPP